MANIAIAHSNEATDNIILGYSDLRALQSQRPLVLTGGDGIRVIDENGRRYIEACASFFCASLGYSEDELAEAAYKQLKTMPAYVSASHRTIDIVLRLTEMLIERLPLERPHISYATTGSEANDYAVKFMRYANVYAGRPERRKVISRETSYHGSTVVSSSLGGAKTFHDGFALDMRDYRIVSQPDYFNKKLPGESEADFVARLAAELESVIQEAGPETVGLFVAEPISFSAGLIPPPAGYFQAIKQVLDRHGILFLDDEVITGFGRTGEWFGVDQILGFKPDMMSLSKSITGSYFPLSATVVSKEIYDNMVLGNDAMQGFHHAGTFHGHPAGAAVAVRVIELMEERDILGHVKRMIPVLHGHINALADHEAVAQVRTIGLAGALQLKPEAFGAFGEARRGKLGQALLELCMERGLIVRPRADTVIIGPPLIATAEDYAEIFALLDQGLQDLLDQSRAG